MPRRTLLLFSLILVFATSCRRMQTQTGPNPEIPLSGEAVWKISDVDYRIEGTAVLIMGNQQGLFIVKALCEFQPDSSHRPIAEAIARYAVTHGLQKKAGEVVLNGKPLPFSGSVGVALMRQSGVGIVTTTSGYRYVFTAEDLKKNE